MTASQAAQYVSPSFYAKIDAFQAVPISASISYELQDNLLPRVTFHAFISQTFDRRCFDTPAAPAYDEFSPHGEVANQGLRNRPYGSGQFMNPGPAPRPPTDRPRLNYIPSTVGLPGNQSQLSLHSTLLLGNEHIIAPSRSTTLTNNSYGGGGIAILKEGTARCKEGLMWKHRYLVLRAFQLDFQKNRDGKVAMTIQLRDVTSVARSENSKLSFEVVRVANPENATRTPSAFNRDLPQKTMVCQCETDEEIYGWIEAIGNRCPGMGGVSNPTNFSHRVHVGFDPTNGQFVGLPTEWERLLNASAITKEDYKKHPEAVVEVLQFYSDITNRNENPDMYPSLTPTPPVSTNQNMQLGHGGGGTAIAPPRPPPPSNYVPSSRSSPQNESPTSRTTTPVPQQPNVSIPEQDNKTGMDATMRSLMEKEARKIKAAREQRDRAVAEEGKNRRDQASFDAAIPKTRPPMAKQELSGYGGSADEPASSRFNPSRNAPPAPGVDRSRQQLQGSLRAPTAQRQAPQPPTGSVSGAQGVPRAPFAQKEPSSRSQSPSNAQQSLRTPSKPEQQRQPSPNSRAQPNLQERTQTNHNHVRANGALTNGAPTTSVHTNGAHKNAAPTSGANTNGTHANGIHTHGAHANVAPTNGTNANGVQTNGTSRAQPPTRIPAVAQPVAPLNVKQPTGAPADGSDSHKQTELAMTAKGPAATRQKEVRMSSMTESQVMEKLKQVVSKDDPQLSYSKQKKIGQGASGSVYVAKIQENAISPVAKRLYKNLGAKSQVAIKQMDLRNQPRKELIVNEIIVMKESSHPNIVNFLDSFLQEGNNELWVVMEFMEGGALTDVIDNNPHISEAQISTICNEVRRTILTDWVLLTLFQDMQRPCASTQPKHHSS